MPLSARLPTPATALLWTAGLACQRRGPPADSGPTDTAAQSHPSAASPFGLYNGLNVHQESDKVRMELEEALALLDDDVEQMRALGMGTSRIHPEDGIFSFAWPGVDEDMDGRGFDFSWQDALLSLACERGIDLLPTVAASPRAEASTLPYITDKDAFQIYVGNLVERYDGDEVFSLDEDILPPDEQTAGRIRACPIRTWMIGNEPDNACTTYPDWCGVEQYVELFLLADEAARAADAECALLYGGIGIKAMEVEERLQFLQDFLASEAEMDEMAVHIYPKWIDVESLRSFVEATVGAADKENFWVTEAGFAGVYEATYPGNGIQDSNASELSQVRQLLTAQLMTMARGSRAQLLIGIYGPQDELSIFYGYGLHEPGTQAPWFGYWSYRKMVELLGEVRPEQVESVFEDPKGGRYAYRVAQEERDLYLLTYDPASLPSYVPDGPLDEGQVVFSLEVGTGQALLIQAVPQGETGTDIEEPVFEEEDLGSVDGTLVVEVGPRPVWLSISP